MKCQHCDDTLVVFTIIPTISKDVGWASHVLSEMDGKIGVYHYECGRVNFHSTERMLSEIINDI